jgi:hypothetical protein
MEPEEAREWVLMVLFRHGFHRIELLDDLDQLPGAWERSARETAPALLLANLSVAHTGESEPLAGVRHIERTVKALGELPTVILSDAVDPTVFLAQASTTRFLGLDASQEDQWVSTLDALLQI